VYIYIKDTSTIACNNFYLTLRTHIARIGRANRMTIAHIRSRVTSFAMIYASRGLRANLYLLIHRNNEQRPRNTHACTRKYSLPFPLIHSREDRRDLEFRVSMHSPLRTVYYLSGFIASSKENEWARRLLDFAPRFRRFSLLDRQIIFRIATSLCIILQVHLWLLST